MMKFGQNDVTAGVRGWSDRWGEGRDKNIM